MIKLLFLSMLRFSKRIKLLWICCLITFNGMSQDNNFHKPLKIPLSIGAYFGDLRPNHFHMGIDYRTNGVEGLDLHAIYDGYVSRVRVSPYGYGKVVYINHPNGITSVYAHCSKFIGKLDSLVTAAKIKRQNNEIELYLTPNEIPLKKGEIFALSGNTGSSTGPHLHFEIRETATDTPMNPLLFGLGNKDIYKPTIKSVYVYCLSKDGYMIPNKLKTFGVSNGKLTVGNCISLPASYSLLYGNLGFGISGYDQHSTGSCGLYENKIFSNAELIYQSKMDKVSFEETRYINTYKDFSKYSQGEKIHKLFNNPMNKISSMHIESKKLIKLFPCDSIPITIETRDAFQNKEKISFGLKINEGENDTTNNFFPETLFWLPNKSYSITLQHTEIVIDTFSLYEPTPIKLTESSDKITIGNENQAIHKPIIIGFTKSFTGNIFNKNYFIGYLNKGKYDYCESYIEGNKLKTKALKFGTYKIICDTIKPIIKTSSYSTYGISTKSKVLNWTISDSESKIANYNIYINGEWVPANYEYKNKQLFCNIPIPFKEISCIQVIVSDVCRNINVFETNIP